MSLLAIKWYSTILAVFQASRMYRTGIVKSPPLDLLAAASKLRAVHEPSSRRVPKFLQEMLIFLPEMTKYVDQSASQNRLFRASHPLTQISLPATAVVWICRSAVLGGVIVTL
ncbi:hypothetical protein V8C35DRAFT_160769 [Trichoderma chlorosporum]